MSKRSEERALQRYALKEITHESVKLHDEYMCGYEQAEKDLALTLKDVKLIIELYWIVSEQKEFKTLSGVFQEVLRRFNETKNKQ